MGRKEVKAAIDRQMADIRAGRAKRQVVEMPYLINYAKGVNYIPRKSVTRQPSLKMAEDAAYIALISMGLHFPADPLAALRRLKNVNVYTYEQAVRAAGMMKAEFERRCGHMDGFTLRHADKRGEVCYAVVYRPRQLASRTRFTLAHELGHILLGHSGTPTADDIEADHFASCFLAPRCCMQDLPLDRVLAKRCYITAKAAQQCRWRRWEPVNPQVMAHLYQWYKWEEFYQRQKRIYNEGIQKKFPGRGERIIGMTQWRMDAERPGDVPEEAWPEPGTVFVRAGEFQLDPPLLIQNLDMARPLWTQCWPTHLSDVVYTIPGQTAKELWMWGRRHPEGGPLTGCPHTADCPHAQGCALNTDGYMPGLLEGAQGEAYDELQAMWGDMEMREFTCPFLCRMNYRSPRPRWKAYSAEDFVLFPGKFEKKFRKKRKKC